MAKPLDGIRILEWAVWLAGPGATMMLGDLGAEIIKIEQPVTGDPSRGIARLDAASLNQTAVDRAFTYTTVNRNKKCITIDVTKEEGREAVYRIVSKCDVFLQNFRPSVRDQAKLDYATLSKYNPKLIYANVSAFGPDGLDAKRRGNDYIGQARSGFMSTLQSYFGEPVPIGQTYADHMASIITAYGILAALVARERLGIGQEIDSSLTGSMLALQHVRLSQALFYKREYLERSNRKAVDNPLFNHYKCKDNKWIVFSILASDIVWPDFCRAVGIENLEKQQKFENTLKRAANNRELIEILDKVFATKTRDEWEEIISKYHRIMYSPVNDAIDVGNDPQIVDNKYVIEYEQPPYGKIKSVGCPIKFHATPAGVQGPSPEFGQNTEEVLIELGGYSWDDIGKFKDHGITG